MEGLFESSLYFVSNGKLILLYSHSKADN